MIGLEEKVHKSPDRVVHRSSRARQARLFVPKHRLIRQIEGGIMYAYG